jgi:hypothetical protein
MKMQPIPPSMIAVYAAQPGIKIAHTKKSIPKPMAVNAENAIDLEADTN